MINFLKTHMGNYFSETNQFKRKHNIPTGLPVFGVLNIPSGLESILRKPQNQNRVFIYLNRAPSLTPSTPSSNICYVDGLLTEEEFFKISDAIINIGAIHSSNHYLSFSGPKLEKPLCYPGFSIFLHDPYYFNNNKI